MRKPNCAANVTLNMPYDDVGKRDIVYYMYTTTVLLSNILSTFMLERRIYTYIFVRRAFDAEAPEGRSELSSECARELSLLVAGRS